MFAFWDTKVREGPANPATVTKSFAALPVTPIVIKQFCPKVFPAKAGNTTIAVGVGEASVCVAPAIKFKLAVTGVLPLGTAVPTKLVAELADTT